MKLLAPLVVGGIVLAVLVGVLAGFAYAIVLAVVILVVAAAIVGVHSRGRRHGDDGSQSSDVGSPHQGFDASPLGDTDQLSGPGTVGPVGRERVAQERR